MDYQKGFIFLLQVLIYLIGLTIGQQPLFHNCGNNGNYTQNSEYQTNLIALLSSLSTNVSRYGFYNASVGENSDRVNAIVLCRGDVQLDECRTCINELTAGMLLESCQNQKEAIGVQDNCMLRYSNNSIVGKMTTDPSFTQSYPEDAVSVKQFNQELTTLLDSLREKAANAGSHSKFAVGVRNAPDDKQIIYALVQCTPDLSADDCNRCLINGSTEGIPRCCNGKRGGRVVGPSCNIRYATDQFFYDISSESGETPLGEGQPPLKLFCIKSDTYTENSTYQANLNALLSSLSSNVNTYGFYNASVGQNSDRVNAVVLCRGDVQLDTCRACINNSTRVLVERCKNKKEAIVWYDYCMVRYSNKSIIGTKATDDPAFSMSHPENSTSVNQFNQELKTLLDSLRDQAAYAGPFRKFATGNRTAPGFQTIYALEQCVPNLSLEDCSDCLSTAVERIPVCCDGKKGVRVVGRSCNLRYETYRFFNETTSSEDGQLPPAQGDNDRRTLIIIILVISVFGGLMLIACIWFILRKRKRKSIEKLDTKEDITTMESLHYDFDTVSAATNYFSDANKLGQGGFGVVYKGKLPNGQEIAVKRLSKDSGQGDLEFKNEVLLVAKLQHRNLVRLLGFCLQGIERLLIYEFMPKESLDKLMFDPVKRAELDWDRRYKIIVGVVKGLLYLHEDSRLRIIHRDLKASNVLLDEELNPKISDFGMARLFVLDQTQASTSRIVGTYGYMSPEYAMYGQFSAKSDVFSFGVLVLEIVSGQRSTSFRNGEHVEDLPSYAWKNWRDGTAANVIDPILRASPGSMRDIMRCIHIGLLCVQEHVNDRPTMASVFLMLNSFSFTLPIPSEPAFLMHSGLESEMPRSDEKNGSRMLESGHASVNEASITELYPR